MHRRQFLAASAALLLPTAPVRAAQDAVTPAATPNHHGRPRPIVLGHGIELVDYRIYPSTDVPRIIGEIVSTRDDMVDSPVVSITFPDLDANGLAWAAPVLPVMRSGESNMIFGVLPEGVQNRLEYATFGLCESVNLGALTELSESVRLRPELVNDDRKSDSLHLTGKIFNDGQEPTQWIKIRGLARDDSGRYVGALPEIDLWNLRPGESKSFSIWQSRKSDQPANPFRMVSSGLELELELHPGTMGYSTAPGCAALFARRSDATAQSL